VLRIRSALLEHRTASGSRLAPSREAGRTALSRLRLHRWNLTLDDIVAEDRARLVDALHELLEDTT
jgi:hypothetical protein